jgi:hypothetical protein
MSVICYVFKAEYRASALEVSNVLKTTCYEARRRGAYDISHMRRSGNREVVHTSTTLLVVEVLGTESSTAPRHTQQRSRGNDGDGRMGKFNKRPTISLCKSSAGDSRDQGDQWWRWVASRRVWSLMRAVCTASSVEDFVRAGPGSTLCQDKERCSASKVLLPGCMKEGSCSARVRGQG